MLIIIHYQLQFSNRVKPDSLCQPFFFTKLLICKCSQVHDMSTLDEERRAKHPSSHYKFNIRKFFWVHFFQVFTPVMRKRTAHFPNPMFFLKGDQGRCLQGNG